MSIGHVHHVLIVEDDYAFRWALGVRCYKRGLEIDVAENGAEAIDMIAVRESRYCGVILDLVLPRVNGEEVLERLGQTKVPVVVVTGHPKLFEELNQKQHASVRKVMLKPVDVDEVITSAIEHCAHGTAFS